MKQCQSVRKKKFRHIRHSPTSPSSLSIHKPNILESELQIVSLTLYPHLLSTSPSVACLIFLFSLKPNSPCLKPFLSRKTTSCLSSFPAPPPPNPNLWVPTIRFPLGFQARVCSSPATGSEVDWRAAWRSYTRSTLCRSVSGVIEDRDETTKKAPSPLQLIRGMVSSSGLDPTPG